jgi:ERF superfamily
MSETKLALLKRLQTARARLHGMELKKSGVNNFNQSRYFELSDFLPQAQKIFDELDMCGIINFSDPEKATLAICDVNSDDHVDFYCPLAESGVKGATALQQQGAIQTYVRRYLWVQALEICENDEVDTVDPKVVQEEQEKKNVLLQETISKIRKSEVDDFSWIDRKKFNADELKTLKAECASRRKQLEEMRQLSDKEAPPVSGIDWIKELNDTSSDKDAFTSVSDSIPDDEIAFVVMKIDDVEFLNYLYRHLSPEKRSKFGKLFDNRARDLGDAE